MVRALGVPLQLRTIKIHIPQVARAVPLRLIVKVRGRRIAALPAGGHGFGPHVVAELDDSDEAVPAGAIPLLRSRVRARTECG